MAALMERLSRKALRLGTRVPGALAALRRTRARELAVVMFHGVAAQPLPFANWCHLPLAEFARQIDFLAEHYTVLGLAEAVTRLEQRRPLPRSPVVITFDDGYRSVLTAAAPLLARHGMPATVFLVTGLIDSGQPPWTDLLYHALERTVVAQVHHGGRAWDVRTPQARLAAHEAWRTHLKAVANDDREAYLRDLVGQLGVTTPVPRDSVLATLGWDEIETLRATGLFEFGSHTHTHPLLARCSPAVQEDELRRSRSILQERLGRCDFVAYPNGGPDDFNRVTLRLTVELGYRGALTTISGLNRAADLAAMRRINVANDTGLNEFARLMVGC